MKKFFKIFLGLIILSIIIFSLPELFHKNEGKSITKGSVRKGKLENGYLMPYRGNNFKYFSAISYYLMDNGYTNSRVYHTVLDAYKIMETETPHQKFQVMECSDKCGGKLMLHYTHQNGLSIDFMSPMKGKGLHYNDTGLLHYLLDYDEDGKLNLNKKAEIDFETMAKHILALEKAGKKHGVRIKKVILKINLKDNLFATKSGKILKNKNIYFAQRLTKLVDNVHDDHYHIDFELID